MFLFGWVLKVKRCSVVTRICLFYCTLRRRRSQRRTATNPKLAAQGWQQAAPPFAFGSYGFTAKRSLVCRQAGELCRAGRLYERKQLLVVEHVVVSPDPGWAEQPGYRLRQVEGACKLDRKSVV